MPGAHVPVTAQGLHVHRAMGQGLAAIHQHVGANAMGHGGDLRCGIEAAQGVAQVDKGDQPGAFIEQLLEMVHVHLPLGGDAHMAQHGAGAPGHQLPGHQVAVVLHHAQHHFITGLEVIEGPTVGHQVDGLRGIAAEDDFPGISGANEAGHCGAGCFKGLRGPGAEGMGATMHVGIVAAVVLHQGINDLPGLLAGGGMVHVHQGLALQDLLQ